MSVNEAKLNITYRRRHQVRQYLLKGIPVYEMVERLTNQDLLPKTYTHSQKLRIIKDDIRRIGEEDRKAYLISKANADAALVEYIERQKYLYKEAIKEGKLELASELSKDIARAQGVPTDETVKVEMDIVGAMKAAFQKIKERKQIGATKLLPEQEVQVEPKPPEGQESE